MKEILLSSAMVNKVICECPYWYQYMNVHKLSLKKELFLCQNGWASEKISIYMIYEVFQLYEHILNLNCPIKIMDALYMSLCVCVCF